MDAKEHMYTDNSLCDEELEKLVKKSTVNQTEIF